MQSNQQLNNRETRVKLWVPCKKAFTEMEKSVDDRREAWKLLKTQLDK